MSFFKNHPKIKCLLVVFSFLTLVPAAFSFQKFLKLYSFKKETVFAPAKVVKVEKNGNLWRYSFQFVSKGNSYVIEEQRISYTTNSHLEDVRFNSQNPNKAISVELLRQKLVRAGSEVIVFIYLFLVSVIVVLIPVAKLNFPSQE